MRYQQSRQVSDILTQDLLAIDAKIGKRAVAIKLQHHLRSHRLIPGQVIGSPPVTESSPVVVNVPQFVKAVADFVSHTRTGRSIIGSGITIAVEIWWLQQGGREKFGIGAEHDHRGDLLRIDSP